MGCGCQAHASTSAPVAQTTFTRVLSVDCPYTIEQVNSWLVMVECIKSNGYYTQIPNITTKQLNIYIGILLSAQNYSDNLCYFKNELEEVESFIIVITNMNLCLN